MAGNAFKTRIPVVNCGCGGQGIIWDRGSGFGDGVGTIEAFCSKHCGIRVGAHGYGIDRDYRKTGNKVVRTWNRAMVGAA